MVSFLDHSVGLSYDNRTMASITNICGCELADGSHDHTLNETSVTKSQLVNNDAQLAHCTDRQTTSNATRLPVSLIANIRPLLSEVPHHSDTLTSVLRFVSHTVHNNCCKRQARYNSNPFASQSVHTALQQGGPLRSRVDVVQLNTKNVA